MVPPIVTNATRYTHLLICEWQQHKPLPRSGSKHHGLLSVVLQPAVPACDDDLDDKAQHWSQCRSLAVRELPCVTKGGCQGLDGTHKLHFVKSVAQQ